MKKFFYDLNKIKNSSKMVFYVYHLSVAFVIGFLLSLFVNDDKERFYIISIGMVVTITLLMLFGGYKGQSGHEKR